jgi:hypothetical protein
MDAGTPISARQSINIVKVCGRRTLPHGAHWLGIRCLLAVQSRERFLKKPLPGALIANLRHLSLPSSEARHRPEATNVKTNKPSRVI